MTRQASETRPHVTRPASARRLGQLGVVGLAVAMVSMLVGVGSAGATIDPGLGYDPLNDMGSLSAITQMVGAQNLWAAGYTGKGVGVALIDTGVTRVPGLNAAGQVIDGPDLSFDSQYPALAHLDAFGHGTHMASIIAGRDPITPTTTTNGKCATCLNKSPYSDTTKFEGVAPDATLISIKVGASDGANDVSQIAAGIDWAVAHRNGPGLNIRVINLSYGTNSRQPYQTDPIAFAAENAWRHGIVVVAAAGNDGDTTTVGMADPAYDPAILAVGADDPNGTLNTSDDTIPSWADHGTAARPVDVVAPAVHVLGLRVPGSQIDVANPTAVVGTRFIRGSGTSQAAAVVSGTAALLAQKYPTATPDQIKAMLRLSAFKFGSSSDGKASYRGMGFVNDTFASLSVSSETAQAVALANPALGTGTLDAARGGIYVSDNGIDLTGERDIFANAWNPLTYVPASTTVTVWNLGQWRHARWTADTWATSTVWGTTTWTATDWAGQPWTNATTTNPTWDGSRWKGSAWSGSRWKGSRWSGSRWSGSRWG